MLPIKLCFNGIDFLLVYLHCPIPNII